MLVNERLELGAQGGVPAERKLGLDPLLDGRQTELTAALDLQPRERLELQIGQRPAPPKQLPAKHHRRLSSVDLLKRMLAIGRDVSAA